MASPSSPQHEPTMEEILASIRKIISEDSSDSQPAPAAVVAAPQPVAQAAAIQEADVLELTQEIQEVPPPPPAPIQPAPVAPAPVVAAAAPPPSRNDEVIFQTVEEAPAPIMAKAPASSDGLVTDKTRRAIDDALSGLDFGLDEPAPLKAAAPQQAPRPLPPIDGRSVEAVFDRAVRETFDPVLRSWLHEQGDVLIERMKPAIQEWMEQHLPDMLKAAVEEEVARAVRSRTRR